MDFFPTGEQPVPFISYRTKSDVSRYAVFYVSVLLLTLTNRVNIIIIRKVKLSRYTPWRRLGGEKL
jgi:hypothetical protein